MGKHAIGGMRSMMVANRNSDMRFRKKSYLRNKERADVGWKKKGGARAIRNRRADDEREANII